MRPIDNSRQDRFEPGRRQPRDRRRDPTRPAAVRPGGGTPGGPTLRAKDWRQLPRAAPAAGRRNGQDARAQAPPPPQSLPVVLPAHVAGFERLTLEEAKQRVLANNKLLALAAMNIEGKQFATKAVRSDYYPKVLGTV